MKQFCPNKASKEFKELASIFGEDKAYFLWMRNKGNELDKAPNGAESKLFQTLLDQFNGDRREALIAKSRVYSNYFFNWFGDWVNSPESSSKVVDENGEPLIVYHRTPSKFDEFKDEYNDYNSKGGFYFASKNTLDFGFETSGVIATAEIEGIYLFDMPLFINMRNPGEYSEYPSRLEKQYDGGFAKFNTEEISLEDLPDDINRRSSLNKKEYLAYQQNKLKELQKDNYILSGFVKNPNQIKSATDNSGAFSKDDDNIYHNLTPTKAADEIRKNLIERKLIHSFRGDRVTKETINSE